MVMARQLAFEKPLFVVRKLLFGMYAVWFLSDTTARSSDWIIFQVPLTSPPPMFRIGKSCEGVRER
jgi:hypothetical protein